MGTNNEPKEMERGSRMFELFGDYFQLTKGLINGDQYGNWPDEYWEKAIAEVDAFYRKYPGTFAKELAVALMNELDRRYKEDVKEKEKLLQTA